MRNIRFHVLIGLCAVANLLAQTDRGVITGTVKDVSGAVVPGAQVTAIQTNTNANFKTKTTTSGDFTVPSLPVGTYQVRVENTGFKTFLANKVEVAAGATVPLDVTMELGTTQQTVEVLANAQMLQTEAGRGATGVSSRVVGELPVVVNGAVRSPFDLSASAAEVNSTGQYRVGGGRGGAYGMTLDGTSVTTAGQLDSNGVTWTQINTPSVDALTEFSVTSGGFKADMGHASRGSMSFVSKSGTNAFHGDIYEFLRNQDLDAKGFYGATKPVYKQNDFGVTAGGPVRIPKLYNGKDKTFFFVSYEGFRNRIGATPSPYSVPPPEFYTGDLHNYVDASGKMYQIYDPSSQTYTNGTYSRLPFPNNQIPQSRIDPVAKSIIGYVQPLLAPNVPGLVAGTSAYVRNNYISAGSSISPNNKFSIKGDQMLTSKQRISFFFERTREKDLFGVTGSWDENHGSVATFSGAPQSKGLQTVSTGWKEKGICIPNYPDCNLDFPQVNWSNSEFTNWGQPAPNGSDNIVVEFHDDLTKSMGHHTFKAGYYYNNTHYNGFGLQNIAGNVTFQALNTGVPLVTSQATGGGSSFASFLLGQVSGYSLDTTRYLATMFRTNQMYFQDDWRVTSKLTLNLGLRWELNLAPSVGQDEASDFSPSLPNPGAGGLPGALIFAGTGPGRTGSHTLVGGWNGFGPRLGFAYALNSKTAIRGAASRSYGPITYVGSSSHNLGIIQRITVNDQSQGLSPLWTLQNGAPAWSQVPNINPSVG